MTNKTVKLSLVAIATFFSVVSANAQTTEPKKAPDPEKSFNRVDANKDGKVDKEEAAKQEKGPFGKRFDQIDENKDGVVTMEEWKAFQAKMKKKPE